MQLLNARELERSIRAELYTDTKLTRQIVGILYM